MKVSLPTPPWGSEPASRPVAMTRVGGQSIGRTVEDLRSEARDLYARFKDEPGTMTEVLRLRASGLQVSEVAARLSLTDAAVSGYLSRARARARAAE